MLGCPTDALEARHDELGAAMAAARSSLKTMRQRQKDASRRAWVLAVWLTHVVLILYSLAGYDGRVARQYLVLAAKRRRWPQRSDGEIMRLVDDVFLAADVHDVAALADLTDPHDPSAMKAAARFYGEWRLAEWARALNDSKGVAPSTDMVLARHAALRAELPESIRPNPVGCVASAGARCWALRWRRRWGASYRHMPAREDVSAAEISEKVSGGGR
jgi:hypothetical protein